MRSKEERRALHTTPQKTTKDSSAKMQNSTRIISTGDKLYQEIKQDGQTLYTEVKTAKE